MMSFLLQPYLLNSERELEFLRRVADILLLYLLPDQIKKAKLVRQLLREIIACQGGLLESVLECLIISR